MHISKVTSLLVTLVLPCVAFAHHDIDNYLGSLGNLGLTLHHPFGDDIETSEQLLDGIHTLGAVKISEENVTEALAAVYKLLGDFAQAGVMLEDVRAPQTLRPKAKLYTDPSPLIRYDLLLAALQEQADFEPQYHIALYNKIVRDGVHLTALYPSSTIKMTSKGKNTCVQLVEEQRSASQRSNDLINLLANLKRTRVGTYMKYLSYRAAATEADPFPSAEQPDAWFDELNYKLYLLFSIYDSLGQEDKKALTGYLLLGGLYCSDAKWHAVNGAFERFFLRGDRAAFYEEVTKPTTGDLAADLRWDIGRLKARKLTSYINRYVDRLESDRERNSVFNQTWNVLAPRIGLPTTYSRESEMQDHKAVSDFTGELSHFLQATDVIRATKVRIENHLDRTYLGPLQQMVDKDDLVRATLVYLGLLEKNSREGRKK